MEFDVIFYINISKKWLELLHQVQTGACNTRDYRGVARKRKKFQSISVVSYELNKLHAFKYLRG
jgi:hypothetical protein